MPITPDLFTVAEAAEELGLSRVSVRTAINRGSLSVVRLDARTYLVHRSELERYRREHLGRPGKRKKTTQQPVE